MPIHTKILWGEKGIIRKINLAPESRQKELLLRVKMLQLHQKIAMGSLGAFFYQSYLGQQLVNGNYEEYYDLHSKMSKVVCWRIPIPIAITTLMPFVAPDPLQILVSVLHPVRLWI